VIDTDGRVLHSQDTSALEAGKTYDVAAFRKFLTEWSPLRDRSAGIFATVFGTSLLLLGLRAVAAVVLS